MDEFILTVIVGLVIILLLLILFGIDIGSSSVQNKYDDPEPVQSGFYVGTDSVELSKSFNLGAFNVSYTRGSEDISIGYQKVFNGVLFGESGVKFRLPYTVGVERMDVSFRVSRTNSLAPLMIKVNDEIIESDYYELGYYSVSLPIGKTSYDIELVPESSSWRVWSPATYELDDVVFHVESFEAKDESYMFELTSEEFIQATKGSLNINMIDYVGELRVSVNGRDVFYDNVTDYVKNIVFDRDVFEVGENTLEISAGKRSHFYGASYLKVYYDEERKTTLNEDFMVSGWQETNGLVGWINFQISDVERNGGLVVKIVQNNDILMENYANADVKSYRYRFNERNIGVGNNTMVIEALNGAAFTVTNPTVTIS